MKAIRIAYPLLAAVMVSSAMAQSAPAKPAAAAAVPTKPAEAPKAPEPPQPTIVAIIPFQQAVYQSEAGQKIINELKKKYEPKQAALKAESEAIQALEKQLNAPDAKFTEAEKTERKKAIEAKKAHFQHEAQAGQQESAKDYNALMRPLMEKFFKSMSEEAKAKGAGIVVDGSSEQHPVIWVSDELKPLDLTQGAIDRFNKAPAEAPAAAAPAAPAAPAAK